jgi:hypothetical protein
LLVSLWRKMLVIRPLRLLFKPSLLLMLIRLLCCMC